MKAEDNSEGQRRILELREEIREEEEREKLGEVRRKMRRENELILNDTL